MDAKLVVLNITAQRCIPLYLLKSPKSLAPTGGKGQTGPGENPERPNPDDPKHVKQTDTLTRKIQPVQAKTQLTKGCWQI